MKRNLLLFILPVIAASVFFSSCRKTTTPPEDAGFLHGAYIVNEGTYNHNNGSISYIDPDSSYIINNIFQGVNGRPLGDIVQSFTPAGDKGLIVVNHSAKVEVVDLKTFVSLGTITGCDYPRYALYLGHDKAYLTNGAFAGKVYVLDLQNLKITDSIAVGNGPETMVRDADFVYVANSGGWSVDSTVSVIDVTKNEVVRTIPTGDNPIAMTFDHNGHIWVLCKGKVVYDQNWNIVSETDSRLEMISLPSQTVEKSFVIGQKGDYFSPVRLTADNTGEVIYFVEHDGIYAMNAGAMEIPGTPLVPGNFYGLGADPLNGLIYALDAGDFTGRGLLKRYRPDGSLMDTVSVGIAPNGIVFN
ncbi:MAG: hypothetical protein J7K46_00170 [Bacteroidales bacterium]|nr:hypothetical protein [Bacteroidales bacterium]